jgi:hypothetical protein
MTQDEIYEIAEQAGIAKAIVDIEIMGRFANLVAQHEREECAKIADQYVGQDLEHNFSALVAHNIRLRGQA